MLDVHPLTLFGRRSAPPALTSLVGIFYIIILTSLVAIQFIFVIVIFDTLSVNISAMLFTYLFGHQCNKYMTMTSKTKQRDRVDVVHFNIITNRDSTWQQEKEGQSDDHEHDDDSEHHHHSTILTNREIMMMNLITNRESAWQQEQARMRQGRDRDDGWRRIQVVEILNLPFLFTFGVLVPEILNFASFFTFGSIFFIFA